MKQLALLGASLIFALAFSEIGLRIFAPQPTGPPQFFIHPQLGPIPVPNQQATRTLPGIYSYTYTNNSLGLRGPEIRSKTKPRILILGDSFTYGIGVNDNETFSALLQKEFPQYEIINAGNGGKGTDYAMRFYQLIGKSLKPDLVILCFFRNDFVDNQRQVYFDDHLNPKPITERKPFLTRFPFYSFFCEHSHLLNLFKSGIVSRMDGPSASAKRDDTLTRLYLSELSREAHPIIFYVPDVSEVQQQSEDERIFLSLMPTARIITGLSPSDYLGEGHWTSHGHQLAAKFISRHLQPYMLGNQN